MEFTDYKCPVCDKQFKKGDDIVVCPECGTPHHRECYKNEGHCHFEDRHGDDFSFEKEQEEENKQRDEQDAENGIVLCKRCGTENPKEMFYCSKCGAPLYDNNSESADSQNNQQPNFNQTQGMPPFGSPFGQVNPQMAAAFDPMAGMKSNEPITEDVTAGEAAKYVGKNTPYYLRVFNVISKFGKSRFNFAACILSGFYFLYRKMYALGIIFSAGMFGVLVGSSYIMTRPEWQAIYTDVLKAQAAGQNVSFANFFGLQQGEFLFFIAPFILGALRLILMLVSGLIANRSYYKHSVKKIKKIKKTTDSKDTAQTLETKGGVNLPLALCIGIAYIVINYIPAFLV